MIEHEDLLREALQSTASVSKKKRVDDEDRYRKLKLVGSQTRLIDYMEIQNTAKRRNRRVDEEIDQWTGYDFTHFIREKCLESSKWNLNWLSASQEAARVKDALVDVYGFCDNFMFKDYIDFFFDNYCQSLLDRKGGEFYVGYLRRGSVLQHFAKSYNYAARIKEVYTNNEIEDFGKVDVSNVAINRAFLLSDKILVQKYGVILSVNWLILNKNIALDNAANSILKACKTLYKVKQWQPVIRITEQLSPYPLWFPFQSVDKFVSRIDKNFPIDVTFKLIRNTKYKFLRR